MQQVQVLGAAGDTGSVVMFDAVTEDGEPISIGVDYHNAEVLWHLLQLDDCVLAEIEDWMVINQLD